MNRIKKYVKILLSRHKIRKFLFLVQVPVSFIVIYFSRLFDGSWYRIQLNVVDEERVGSLLSSHLLHYIIIGRRKGYTPSPLFIPEYFDPGNWQRSIVDPLTRYILDRRGWRKPTSYYLEDKISDKVTPSDLRNPHELFSDSNNQWVSIKEDLISDMEMYSQQESRRDFTRPVKQFDFSREREWIDQYTDTDTKEPLVSIITPTWNRRELIQQAIKSVQNQTYNNWEMIIVDDGSTDDTVEIVRQIQQNDPRIKLVEPGHGGVSRARNAGLSRSTGEWVAFLDSDNVWKRDFLRTSVLAAIKSGVDAAYSAIRMDNNGRISYRSTEPDMALLQTGNFVDLNALVLKKGVLNKVGYFDETLRRMVDYDLVCRVSKIAKFMYIPIVGVEYTDHNNSTRITTTELVSWDGVVKSKNFIDFSNKGTKDMLSIIVPVNNNISSALRVLKGIVGSISEIEAKYEIIIADSSASPGAVSTLLSFARTFNGIVSYHRFPASHDKVLATNYGIEKAHGEYIIAIDQHVTLEQNAIIKLFNALKSEQDSLCVPLQLKPYRTVHTAGELWALPGEPPIHLLEDHPVSDIDRLPSIYEIPMATTGMYAIHRKNITKVNGLYALLDNGFEVQDLSLRLSKLGVKTKLVKSSRIINYDEKRGLQSSSQKAFIDMWNTNFERDDKLWNEAGFSVIGYKDAISSRISTSIQPELRVSRLDGNGLYRWAIKISAPSDDRRYAWGDMYYAEALGDALRSLGQEVAIDYRESHYRSSSYLDDINLDIRGLDNYQPQEGKLNILWVISHPELVSVGIVNSFDKVYAAGVKWAQDMSTRSKNEIDLLLQCTDTGVFKPNPGSEKYKDKILFIGNSRRIFRPILRDIIELNPVNNSEINVYGDGWHSLIDPKYIKGTFIPNKELPMAYGSSKAVLNDHWKDMKEWGFISNRIFDAVASGAKVITDNVHGVEGVFSTDVVKPYSNKEELAQILSSKWFKDSLTNKQVRDSHSYIHEKHSFTARARTLVDFANDQMTKKP